MQNQGDLDFALDVSETVSEIRFLIVPGAGATGALAPPFHPPSTSQAAEVHFSFVEERFGRGLSLALYWKIWNIAVQPHKVAKIQGKRSRGPVQTYLSKFFCSISWYMLWTVDNGFPYPRNHTTFLSSCSVPNLHLCTLTRKEKRGLTTYTHPSI